MGYAYGTKWTDDLIEKEILDVVKKLNIDYFPTHTEIKQVKGNSALASKIANYKGSAFWAEKLNLPLKYSETSFGNKYEIIAISDIFEHTGLNSIQTSSRHPYDLMVDNDVKVDVKVAKKIKNNCNTYSYSFNLEKREPTCDIFLLYCLNNDETNDKIIINNVLYNCPKDKGQRPGGPWIRI